MKHIHFDIESNGFYGAYWECKDGSDCAVIAMLGDDPEDYMARSAVKWLLRLGVNVLTMSQAGSAWCQNFTSRCDKNSFNGRECLPFGWKQLLKWRLYG